jgi:hypothetical protein
MFDTFVMSSKLFMSDTHFLNDTIFDALCPILSVCPALCLWVIKSVRCIRSLFPIQSFYENTLHRRHVSAHIVAIFRHVSLGAIWCFGRAVGLPWENEWGTKGRIHIRPECIGAERPRTPCLSIYHFQTIAGTQRASYLTVSCDS